MTPDTSPSSVPWYRVPIMWMVIVIPLAAVVGGFVTLALAIRSYDGLVVDDYYRYGKEINKVLARDRAAAAHGLEARLDVDAASRRLRLHLVARDTFRLPAEIGLDLLYATRAGLDHHVRLYRMADGAYYAALPELVIGRYRLQLATDTWRLVGSFSVPGDAHAVLRAGGSTS